MLGAEASPSPARTMHGDARDVRYALPPQLPPETPSPWLDEAAPAESAVQRDDDGAAQLQLAMMARKDEEIARLKAQLAQQQQRLSGDEVNARTRARDLGAGMPSPTGMHMPDMTPIKHVPDTDLAAPSPIPATPPPGQQQVSWQIAPMNQQPWGSQMSGSAVPRSLPSHYHGLL